MTHVIEQLEGHNTVISPETVEALTKNLLSEEILNLPLQLLRQPQQRENTLIIRILDYASSIFINENCFRT
jgi:hypothetical protein